MPKLLIDPLETPLQMAITHNGVILKTAESDLADKPVALENSFAALEDGSFDEIVLVNGPGNFTSLRVAIGFARGMALGMGIATRGVSVFEVDYTCIKDAPSHATLYRDARGGRFYEATFEDDQLVSTKLVREKRPGAMSAEELTDTVFIGANSAERMKALAQLAEREIGSTPAQANYVRPPDAAVSSEKPLVILDE